MGGESIPGYILDRAMAKVMISMPQDLLERVDRAAKKRGTTRSGFLQRCAEREVERPTLEEIERALEEGQELTRGFGPDRDSTELVREDRDERKY